MMVEAITGVLFAGVYMAYGISWFTPIYWLVFFGLLLGTFVDLDELWIPDRVTIGGVILGLIASTAFPELHGYFTWQEGLMASFGGGAVGFGLLLAIEATGWMVFKKPAMGHGDTKLMAAIGCFCGWESVFFTLVCASFLGSIIGITAGILSGKGWRNYYIPFGPFIAGGALIWIFWGQDMWDAYFQMITPTATSVTL
jgi:leader peptidase (prepilin peptidase)/N-methyltransferase